MASYYPYVPPTLPRQYEAVSGRSLNYDPMMRGYIESQIPGMEYATERGRLLDIDEAREAERRREVERELAFREREMESAERLGEKQMELGEKQLALSEEAARQAQKDQLLGLGMSAAGLGLEAYRLASNKDWFGLGKKEPTVPTTQEGVQAATAQPTVQQSTATTGNVALPGAPSAGLTGAGYGAGLGIKGAGYGFTPTSIPAAELENPIWTEAGPAFTTEGAGATATEGGLRETVGKYAPYAGMAYGTYQMLTAEKPEDRFSGMATGLGSTLALTNPVAAIPFALMAMGPTIGKWTGIDKPETEVAGRTIKNFENLQGWQDWVSAHPLEAYEAYDHKIYFPELEQLIGLTEEEWAAQQNLNLNYELEQIQEGLPEAYRDPRLNDQIVTPEFAEDYLARVAIADATGQPAPVLYTDPAILNEKFGNVW